MCRINNQNDILDKNRFLIINRYLSEWNILNLPLAISENEYHDFVPFINDAINDKENSMRKIENYIIDLIGIGFENHKVYNEIIQLITSIKNELKTI